MSFSMATGGYPGVAIPCRDTRRERDPSLVALEPLWSCEVMGRRFEEEWDKVAVGRIAETYGGLTGKTKADFGTGSARYIAFLDVLQNVKITRRIFDRVRIARSESQHRVRPGDILFNVTSETPEDVAMGAVVEVNASDLYLNSFCFGLTIQDRERCDPLFLAYFSRGEPGRTALYKLAQGATRYNLSKRRFLALRLPLPSLPEQRAIAAVLSDVDELIGSLEALIAKKRAIKQAAMQELLTGRTRLPGFGGEWETKRMGDLGTFNKGKGIKRSDLRETGVPCVRYGELYTRYENYVDKPVSKVTQDIADTALPIRRGDLMFAASGETAGEIGVCVAYVGNEPAYAGGDIIVLRASGQDAIYLAHLLNAAVAARQKTRMAQGDAVVHIRADHLAGIALPLPPLTEQRAIATILSEMDCEITALEQRLDKTRAIKQGMMQQLLTGSIRLPIPATSAEGEADP